jgi:hypothetical protein
MEPVEGRGPASDGVLNARGLPGQAARPLWPRVNNCTPRRAQSRHDLGNVSKDTGHPYSDQPSIRLVSKGISHSS